MKGKSVITFGLTGVLALTIGFAKDLQSTKVSAEEQPAITLKQTNVITVITKEEQNMVENMSVREGFIQQENGTGFFFTKEK